MLCDRGLELLERALAQRGRTCWVGEVEDVLRKGELGVFRVLRIGAHDF